MRWISINDVKRLVKQKLYELETGSKQGDELIYDKTTGKYVGHIEGGKTFHQDQTYEPPALIIKTLEGFNNDWSADNGGW
jgi:hypothetical protein